PHRPQRRTTPIPPCPGTSPPAPLGPTIALATFDAEANPDTITVLLVGLARNDPLFGPRGQQGGCWSTRRGAPGPGCYLDSPKVHREGTVNGPHPQRGVVRAPPANAR